jgi:CBS domain-containing protein
VLGWFLGQAARGAVASSRFSERLEGVTVADVMDEHPVAVPDDVSVGDAQDAWFLRYRFDWFPVVDGGGRFLGVLREDAIERALSDGRPELPVGQLVEDLADGDELVPRDTPIEHLLGSEPLRRMGALVVVDGERRLCGVVTLDQVRRALAAAAPARLG